MARGGESGDRSRFMSRYLPSVHLELRHMPGRRWSLLRACLMTLPLPRAAAIVSGEHYRVRSAYPYPMTRGMAYANRTCGASKGVGPLLRDAVGGLWEGFTFEVVDADETDGTLLVTVHTYHPGGRGSPL